MTYNVFTIQPGQFWRVYMSPQKKNFSVFLGGGGVVGYEGINNGSNELPTGPLFTRKVDLSMERMPGLKRKSP